MLETIIWLAIGAFIGWNFPQPKFAKSIQEKVWGFVGAKDSPNTQKPE